MALHSRIGLDIKFEFESAHELLMNLNLNSTFAKSINLNLSLVFANSMNMNLNTFNEFGLLK